MLEKMDDFFKKRVGGYDEHMRNDILGASEFYPFTASQLPKKASSRVVDLGCGTGLELEDYFSMNPDAIVTGIDLSATMLDVLAKKLPGKALRLIRGSYFDIPLGNEIYDAAVSVESLHHFSAETKIALYRKLHSSLKKGGYFILTDYFAESPEQENALFAEFARLKQEENLSGQESYHFDTPLTVGHEIEALKAAGFSSVRILKNWGATYTLRANR